MENLQKLQRCYRKEITFKKTFVKFGVTEDDKPLKEMNQKEEFSALVNWITNKMPENEDVELRYKVEEKLYQNKISKRCRGIRVRKPKIEDENEESITYAWPDFATYENMDVDIITISVVRAKAMNEEKRKEQELNEQETTARGSSQINWNMEEIQQGIGAEKVLTKEEMELINEFLQV